MASTFRIEDDYDQRQPGDRSRSWLKGCLIGCGIVAVGGVILAVLLAIWVTRNLRDWGAAGAAFAIKEGINQTDLPAQEKKEIQIEIDRALVAFQERRITDEQAMEVVEKLLDSPLMTALIASAAEKKYLDNSGLNDQERKEAHATLQRFLRGSIDGDIDERSADAALRHVADRQPDGQWEFRDKVSDEDLWAFLTEAKKAADEAKIPDQPDDVDPSEEVKRIIDEAMNEPAAAPDAD